MNDSNFQFAMYNPVTNTVEVNTGSVLLIRCKDFNSTVISDAPKDIVYLYQLAEDQPLTYAKFAMSDTRLQDYLEAINEFN